MNLDPFISILKDINILYDDIVVVGDFNNSLLIDNPLIGPMFSLHLSPVNLSILTHIPPTSSSLIDRVFANHIERIQLYDQILASCFSNHDLLFLNYNIPVICAVVRYITYRDLRNINYTTLKKSPWSNR